MYICNSTLLSKSPSETSDWVSARMTSFYFFQLGGSIRNSRQRPRVVLGEDFWWDMVIIRSRQWITLLISQTPISQTRIVFKEN
jgi:hypothetical protein